MVKLVDVVSFLNKELVINSVPDKTVNGLQVEGSDEVKKIGFVVDLTARTIKQAIAEECDLLISHHGLIWQPLKEVTGITGERLSLLLKNDISAYVAHLPMDIHKKYSHGYLLGYELGLHGLTKFGESDGHYFGFSGMWRKTTTLNELSTKINTSLSTQCQVFPFGKKTISSLAIVSGGGGFAIEQAKDIDCFVTGEMSHDRLMIAKDLGINVILGGHYETETLGLKKLMQTVTKKFKIHCLFIAS